MTKKNGPASMLLAGPFFLFSVNSVAFRLSSGKESFFRLSRYFEQQGDHCSDDRKDEKEQIKVIQPDLIDDGAGHHLEEDGADVPGKHGDDCRSRSNQFPVQQGGDHLEVQHDKGAGSEKLGQDGR